MNLSGPASAETTAPANQLERHLQGRLGARLRGVCVLVRDDGLVLKGRAPNYYTKQLAQHLIMRETDLPILANEIEVV